MIKNGPLITQKNGQKQKKLFFSAPERARTVLNVFLECIYFDKMDGRRLYGRTVVPDFRNIQKSPKIPVYFRTGVSNSSFGKIFGKFREIFGHSKPG